MPSASSPRSLPVAFAGFFPSEAGPSRGDFHHVLDRVRTRLGVKLACLEFLNEAGVALECWAGTPFFTAADAAIFQAHAVKCTKPLVVPDIGLEDRFAALAGAHASRQVGFYAVIPICLADGRPGAFLSLYDSHPRRPELAERLVALATEAMALTARQRAPSRIEFLTAQLAAHKHIIAAQADELEHTRMLFKRASATAKIGVWECDLDDESLTWTDGVYDIFEMSPAQMPQRGPTLNFYTAESRAVLEVLRSQAIADQSGFALDAEITTARGNRRWVRITATVESEGGRAVRIFGMKQDITEEKTLLDRTRYLAEFDVMTGLANRARFQSRLAEFDGAHFGIEQDGALLLIDLDGFKRINDTFGHARGDECLKETARRLESVCHGVDLVARIGGDEFAVVLGPSFAQAALKALAGQIVMVLAQSVAHAGCALDLGASVGIARTRPGARGDLFKQADAALYAAKAAGRGTFRMYDEISG